MTAETQKQSRNRAIENNKKKCHDNSDAYVSRRFTCSMSLSMPHSQPADEKKSVREIWTRGCFSRRLVFLLFSFHLSDVDRPTDATRHGRGRIKGRMNERPIDRPWKTEREIPSDLTFSQISISDLETYISSLLWDEEGGGRGERSLGNFAGDPSSSFCPGREIAFLLFREEIEYSAEEKLRPDSLFPH